MRLSFYLSNLLRYVMVLSLITSMTLPANAQSRSVSIIRDAEVEALIRDFSEPLFKAAGIRPARQIYLVADRRFNAFVVENGSMFINYGTILEVETPNALKAVLAHEIGHLAGGHLARLREQMDINARLQIAAMLLGIGAVAASAGRGGRELGEMASAFILASQSVGQNSLLAYRRSEESAADAAALKLLARTNQSAKGLVDVLTKFKQDQIARSGAGPYLSSHPLPEDRLQQVTQAARSNGNWNKADSNRDIQALALAKAKLVGFLESQQAVLNRYPNSDKSLAARYARTISAYKAGAAPSALSQMPKIVQAAPSNPYLNEMLGQMYFETGQPQKALAPLRKAVQLAPQETQIRILYGQALIDAGDFAEATAQLNRAAREDASSPRPFVLLSRAYAGLGREGEATLAAAEAALARGEKSTALGLARKAQSLLNKSSPAWLRADDVILSLS